MSEANLWFKVLKSGRSCHGGSHAWSLPAGDQPGAWHELSSGTPVLCERGFHVTQEPAHWFGPGRDVYVAEIAGDITAPNPADADATKVAAQRCRLIRLATASELESVGIYVSGSHVCRPNKLSHASGSATVKAYDSATVEAYGSATVEASGSATVEAYDSATVEAYGSATVKAYDSATVEASDSATVKAYDSATVVVTRHAKPTVTLEGKAAEISWASGWAEFRRASSPPSVNTPSVATDGAGG